MPMVSGKMSGAGVSPGVLSPCAVGAFSEILDALKRVKAKGKR